MVLDYSTFLQPYAYVRIAVVIDDFGNELRLAELRDFWAAMDAAMRFVPFDHAHFLAGEH